MKQEVTDIYDITHDQVEKILSNPQKKIVFEDGRKFTYIEEHDFIYQIENISFTLPDTNEMVDSFEEYIEHVRNNNLKTLEEVKEELGYSASKEKDSSVTELTLLNKEYIEEIWEAYDSK